MARKEIKYNPLHSVKKNAKLNNVSEDAIRYHIRKYNLSRRYDRKQNIIDTCRKYLKRHPSATKTELHKKKGYSLSTIRKYWKYIISDIKLIDSGEKSPIFITYDSCSVFANGKELASVLLSQSHDVIKFAETIDISPLRTWIQGNAHKPLICIGNGGKRTSYPALLYEMMSCVARTITPLEFASMSPNTIKNSKVLLMSSSGKNQDINFATRRALKYTNDTNNIALITFSNKDNNYANKILNGQNVFLYKNPYEDGFISIRSRILLYSILHRAFTDANEILPKIRKERQYNYVVNRRGILPTLKNIKHFCVLYASWGEPVAHDIESICAESGIASVQICDYRNYCHGRYIFGSNNCKDGSTCIVMLISPRERKLADEIKEIVLPANMPIVEICTKYNNPIATIELLLDSMHFVFDVAEKYQGINPNSPPNYSGIDKREPISQVHYIADLNGFGELSLEL